MKIKKILAAFLSAAVTLGSFSALSPAGLSSADSGDKTTVVSESGNRYIVSREQTYSAYDYFAEALSGKSDRQSVDLSGGVWSLSGHYGGNYETENFYCRLYEKTDFFGVSSLNGIVGGEEIDYYDYRHGITLDPTEKCIYVSPTASYWKINETPNDPSYIEISFKAPRDGKAVLYDINNEKITGAINSPFWSFEEGRTDKVTVSFLLNGNGLYPAEGENTVITQDDTIAQFPDLGVLTLKKGDLLTVRITHSEGAFSQSDIVKLTPAVSYLTEENSGSLNVLAVVGDGNAEITARLPEVLSKCGASAYTVGCLNMGKATLETVVSGGEYAYTQYASSATSFESAKLAFTSALRKADWDVVVLEGEYILNTEAFNSAAEAVAAVCGAGTKTAACFPWDVAYDPAVADVVDCVLPGGVAISNASTSYLEAVNCPVLTENGITDLAKTIAALSWVEALCMWQIDLSGVTLPYVPEKLNCVVQNAVGTALRGRYSLKQSKYTEDTVLSVAGDANFDGVTDIRDLVNIKRYFSQNTSVTHLKNADLNADGEILANDMVLLRKALLGEELPEPQPSGLDAVTDENGKIDTSKLTAVKQSEVVTAENGRSYIEYNGNTYLYNAIHWRYNLIESNRNIDPDDYMSIYEEGFRQAKSAGWNSVVQYVYWVDIYDGEKYDFSLVKKFYDLAKKYDMSVQINWFGYDNCGYGGYRPWQTDYEKYPSLDIDYEAAGIENKLPDLSQDIFIEEECEALTQLMAFLNIYDTDRRTVLIQLENEPDNPEGGNGQWLSQFYNVTDLLDKIGTAVHNSAYSIVTRVNVTANGWDEEIGGLDYSERMSHILAKDGVDLLGRGFYGYGLNYQDEFDENGNVLHTPEMGIVIQRYIGQAVESLSRGYGIGAYQLKDCGTSGDNCVFLGSFDNWSRSNGQKINAKYIYSQNDYRYGVKVDTSNVSAIDHTELYALQNCMNSLAELLTTLPRSGMEGFNTYQNAYVLGEDGTKTAVEEQATLNGEKITYTFFNPDAEYGGVGMALADGDGSYYIFATQENSGFEFSEQIASLEIGSFCGGKWVCEETAVPNNAYTVVPKAGRVYKVRLSKEYRAYNSLYEYLTAADNFNEPLYKNDTVIEDGFALSAPWSLEKLTNGITSNDYVVTRGERVYTAMKINNNLSVPGIATYSTPGSCYVGVGFYDNKLLVNNGLSWSDCNGYTNIIKFTAPENGKLQISAEGGLTPAYDSPVYAQGSIIRWDAAPEIPDSEKFAEICRKNNIICAVAHTNATATEAQRGFEVGFSHVTHFYNAVTAYKKRGQTVTAGVVEAAYLNENVTLELICDGKHVPKECVRLALAIKGADKVCGITDATRISGTDMKFGRLGSLENGTDVIVDDGVAKLPDFSSFAGSICTMDKALAVLCTDYGIDILTASKMLSTTPAALIGRGDIGKIEVGCLADLVVTDEKFKVKKVIKAGREI